MRVRVLGSAAGGGFPQWNCGCTNCRDVRSGSPAVRARTQDSLAFSANGEAWFLVNASPDIHRQVQATPALTPRALRHSPIRAIILTNGDLDHILGLFSLRESLPFAIYATDAVRSGLVENAIFRTLERFEGQVVWRRLDLGCEVPLAGTDDVASGLTVEARAAKGKLPVHLEKSSKIASAEDNVGLWIRETATGKSAVYLAATSSVEPRRRWMSLGRSRAVRNENGSPARPLSPAAATAAPVSEAAAAAASRSAAGARSSEDFRISAAALRSRRLVTSGPRNFF